GAAASAGRTRRSCRCRSGRRPARHGRPGSAGSPVPGSGWEWCSRWFRACAAARTRARGPRRSGYRTWIELLVRSLPGAFREPRGGQGIRRRPEMSGPCLRDERRAGVKGPGRLAGPRLGNDRITDCRAPTGASYGTVPESDTSQLLQVVVLLAAAVVAVPVFRRLGLGSVLGYLAAGVAVGPFGLALFAQPEAILHVAELGVVLFLFVVGMEMRPSHLWALRRQIFGLGPLQIGVCAVVLGGLAVLLGMPPPVAFIA